SAFAGSSATKQKFDLSLVEILPGREHALDGFSVLAARVRHGRPDGPFHAYRIEVEGRTIAYTGDTEWVDSLIDIGREADVLIAEAYVFDRKVPFHLDFATLAAHLPQIRPRR